MLEKILNRRNIERAIKAVERNHGAGGVDDLQSDELRPFVNANCQSLLKRVQEGSYKPSPVRKVEILKATGGVRMLGIPTVVDRMLQQATYLALSPIYEEEFDKHSYGFRPGKNAHQAVKTAQGYLNEGYNWIIELDLEKFFDKVNHQKLMHLLSQKVKDKRTLLLINSYLKSGIMEGGLVSQRVEGTPQGSPLASRTHSQTLSFREELKLKEGSFDYIIKSITFMINGTIAELRAGQTDQSYVHTVATGHSPATNSGQVGREVWYISDTGLSLYKPCKRDQRENGDTGELCGVYRQITTHTDQTHQEIVRIARPDDQQSGTYCAGRIFSKAGSCQKRRSKLRYPLPMIVCGSINSRRCIAPLFRAASQLFSQKKIVMN
jgi:hypothetical protein